MRQTCWSLLLLLSGIGPSSAADPLEDLRVPAGFTVSVFAEIPRVRQLASSPTGIVFAGSRGDRVYALSDTDHDGVAEAVRVVAENLDSPAGIAWHDDALYISEVTRVTRWSWAARAPATPTVVIADLPEQRGHAFRPLRFGPDGALYLAVGVPCNICAPAPPFGEILRLAPGAPRPTTWARGIRNTVGLAWHPTTHELWFTDNGRDWLGDDVPACELNRATAAGLHFGYPYRHGAKVQDPEFGEAAPDGLGFTPPALELGAHVAPLGLAFHPGTGWPAEYAGNLFIAEHGSWNRSRKSGYRVRRVVLDATGTRVIAHEDFLTGWLQGDSVSGRPADVMVMTDGALLISDDDAGRIYRVQWTAGTADVAHTSTASPP